MTINGEVGSNGYDQGKATQVPGLDLSRVPLERVPLERSPYGDDSCHQPLLSV